MNKRISFLLFLLFVSLAAFSQRGNGDYSDTLDLNMLQSKDPGTDPSEAIISSDTNTVFRNFLLSKDSLRAWKKSKEYSWINNIDSLLRAEAAKANNYSPNMPGKIVLKKGGGGGIKNGSPGSNDRSSRGGGGGTPITFETKKSDSFNEGILKIILWTIAIGLLLFIIVKLFLGKSFFVKKPKKQAEEEEQAAEEENINEGDFESLKRKALTDNNYRLATRYMFLIVLRRLSERDLIRYSTDKTNSNYLRELPANYQNEFASVSLYYEYVWYGNTALNREQYNGIERSFDHFIKAIR